MAAAAASMACCSMAAATSFNHTHNRARNKNTRIPMFMRRSVSKNGEFKVKMMMMSSSTPPLFELDDPNDAFLSQMASAVASAPELLQSPVNNSEEFPLLSHFSGTARPTSGQPSHPIVKAQYGGGRGSPNAEKSPPPDLASWFLDNRVVYIGMPLVPLVTELIVAQLMWLQHKSRTRPIYMYINSTGSTRDDGEPVALEYEAFAIYDAMVFTRTDIYTVCIGGAMGTACLLLAAGKKGRRFMYPNATALIQQPRVPPAWDMQATDIMIRTKEAVANRDILIELLSIHTGKPIETVKQAMRRKLYMDAEEAIEFGVADRIFDGFNKKLELEDTSGEDDLF